VPGGGAGFKWFTVQVNYVNVWGIGAGLYLRQKTSVINNNINNNTTTYKAP